MWLICASPVWCPIQSLNAPELDLLQILLPYMLQITLRVPSPRCMPVSRKPKTWRSDVLAGSRLCDQARCLARR